MTYKKFPNNISCMKTFEGVSSRELFSKKASQRVVIKGSSNSGEIILPRLFVILAISSSAYNHRLPKHVVLSARPSFQQAVS